MILRERDLPNLWRARLKEIQKTFPNAVIAGGCLRDLACGKEIKDVDVFIPNSKEIQEDLNDFKLNHTTQIIRTVKDSYGNWACNDVKDILTLTWGSLQVEIITVDVTKDHIVDRFDFGICQVQYDGTEVYYTKEFEKDYLNKTFTLINCKNEEQHTRSIKRFEAFHKGKYSDYSLVDAWDKTYKKKKGSVKFS